MKNYYDDISQFGDVTAIITQNSEHISYRTLIDVADKLKEVFDTRCLVFCVVANNLESVAGYIGMLRARVIPVLISPDINKDLFKGLLETYRPTYIWAPFDSSLVPSEYSHAYRYGDYFLSKTTYVMDYGLHSELAQLLTTSGSTGSPKLVRQSYQNIASNAYSIATYLSISQADRPITTLPLNYTYGLSIINSHLLKGSSIILCNFSVMEKPFWDSLKQHSATSFGGVPYTFEMLKKLRFERMNLPSLKTITQAGGRLHVELVKYFSEACESKGVDFIVMYGQTEATSRMSYLPSKFAKVRSNSIGIPIPGGEFWLEDENGQIILQEGIDGELVYKGPNVAMGYASCRQDLSAGDLNGGVLHTGDIARRDSEDFYYITGRKSRFLKIFGSRVSLDEVEQLLRGAQYDVACAGCDDNMEVFVAKGVDAQEVKTFITKQMGLPSASLSIIIVDSIPRNEFGKILYADLKHLVAACNN